MKVSGKGLAIAAMMIALLIILAALVYLFVSPLPTQQCADGYVFTGIECIRSN